MTDKIYNISVCYVVRDVYSVEASSEQEALNLIDGHEAVQSLISDWEIEDIVEVEFDDT